MSQLAPITSPSLSERLTRALEAHASDEAHDLATCEQLLERSTDPVLKMLVSLVVEDGQRHHSLLEAMVRRLEEPKEAVAAPPADHTTLTQTELATTLRALIRDEHEGARHLRHIARQEPHLYDGLYPVLLDAIARDAEKHAAMLRFLLLRAEDRNR
jgi:glutamine synthetase adenylyltransferase